VSVTIDMPPALLALFADLGQDAAQAIKESAIIDLYRRGRLSQADLATALGISRTQVDAVLQRHAVIEDLATESEVDNQLRVARRKLSA
jgi:transcriptional regulator GlxA family with amidase domain